MKRLIVILMLIVGILSGCGNPFNNITFEGYIIEKRHDSGFQILVMENITKEDIEKKSKDELFIQAQDDFSATYFFVKEGKYNELEVGQKVIVLYNKGQPAMESNPPQTDSNKVEVVEE
ncbi:DUF3221 domain-containing protein [Rossellomorea aquimaris]|uniref:DUF3221 domain-containing protein n=1 Tax=Rossellomorea aquimaris TaxID=189382 RepID=A0A5D4U6Q1_9BACI|nr:DUF3221 domain-containing protein [Rossellomorea aquimaris]TYS82922.1 DUF3221 domain-containing protein [Rossellomorea aquimaris]